jgi:hypothetical protein
MKNYWRDALDEIKKNMTEEDKINEQMNLLVRYQITCLQDITDNAINQLLNQAEGPSGLFEERVNELTRQHEIER